MVSILLSSQDWYMSYAATRIVDSNISGKIKEKKKRKQFKHFPVNLAVVVDEDLTSYLHQYNKIKWLVVSTSRMTVMV